MQAIQTLKSRLMRLPVYGASADIAMGALLMPGVTAETDDGVLIAHSATSNADAVGILAELHDYSVNGDALVAGAAAAPGGGNSWFAPSGGADTQYPARLVELIDGATMVSVDYDLTGVAVTSSSGTTVTVASLENNIDTSFLYASAGEALGQLRFVDTSTSGSCTTQTAFTTMTSAGYIVKILPLFHQVVVWKIPTATAKTKLDTTAAVGTGRACIFESHIVRNGLDELLDPFGHRNLSGLNSLTQFKLYAVLHIVNTAFHPID